MTRSELARRARAAAIGAAASLCAGCSAPDGFRTVTDNGHRIATLFDITLVLSALIFLLVTGLLLYSIVRFRERPGGEASSTEGNTRLEIGWTVAPALLLVILFVFVVITMRKVDAAKPGELRVQVIAHRWWWEFRYPDLGVVTANELHVPVGVPLRFEVTSDDVIHSFWVPRFGWKKDAIPGKVNTMLMTVNQAGNYDGACAEYCLNQHAWMRIAVVAQPRDQFDQWAAIQQQPAPQPAAGDAARGQQLFLSNTCSNCHTIRGTTAGGDVGPELTHLGMRSILGAGVLPNTPENLERFIDHVQEIKPGVLMPSFDFNDDELRALAAYLEGLK